MTRRVAPGSPVEIVEVLALIPQTARKALRIARVRQDGVELVELRAVGPRPRVAAEPPRPPDDDPHAGAAPRAGRAAGGRGEGRRAAMSRRSPLRPAPVPEVSLAPHAQGRRLTCSARSASTARAAARSASSGSARQALLHRVERGRSGSPARWWASPIGSFENIAAAVMAADRHMDAARRHARARGRGRPRRRRSRGRGMSPAVIPPAIAPRVGALLRMLGSDHDGEALSAARALRRTLGGVGLDLHALADAVERPAVASPAHRRRKHEG